MVSLGPADHELVTIKGLKALQKSGAVCVPTKSKDNSFEKSITHKIVKELMEQFGFEKTGPSCIFPHEIQGKRLAVPDRYNHRCS